MILPKHSIREMDRTLDLGQDRADYIRLDKNERTIGYPDTVLNEIVDRLRQANWSMYPDQTTLYSSLANFLALPESRILLTSGADTAVKSSWGRLVLATTTSSISSDRRTRLTICPNIGMPLRGFRTFPGRRVDPIRASIVATTLIVFR